jgi:hypothetical protein
MRRLLLAFFTAAGVLLASTPSLAQEKPVSVLSTEDARFLHQQVRDFGHASIQIHNNRPSASYSYTFARRKPEHPCLDVSLRVLDGMDDSFGFAADCKVPYVIKGETYWIWGYLRMAIGIDGGIALGGGTSWVETNADGSGSHIHPDGENIIQLLKDTFRDIVSQQKEYLAFLEERARKPQTRQ